MGHVPIRSDWQQDMQGSRAQVDILNQVLIESAIKAGNRALAKQLLRERLAMCPVNADDNVTDSEEGLLHHRMTAKIQAMV